MGSAVATAAPGGLLGEALARGESLPLRSLAEGPLEGGRVSLARLGTRRAGQGGGRPGGGLQEAVHAGQFGGGVDGPPDGGTVRRAVPARGRVSGSERRFPRPGK